jgi:hypothetical protein
VDLRAGRVSLAFDALRNEGHIAGYADKDEAKAALVRGYVGSIENGRSALLVAPTNVDVDDLNARVHAAVSDRLGEERTYRTAFGKRGFAVGDLVVAREPNRDAAKTVNRDAFTVTGHRDDGRLELRRERDGAAVTWNLLEKPRIDFGYARTSNSSQGRTVDDQFVLPARSRRGAYVDVTRARQNVTIAYGQDEIPDFGRLMAQAQRDNGKTLVRDAVTAQAERVKAAKAEKKRAEDVKRGYSAESIGHFYIDEDEIVRGKDGTEYTIAEGWHTVVAAVSLDAGTNCAKSRSCAKRRRTTAPAFTYRGRWTFRNWPRASTTARSRLPNSTSRYSMQPSNALRSCSSKKTTSRLTGFAAS